MNERPPFPANRFVREGDVRTPLGSGSLAVVALVLFVIAVVWPDPLPPPAMAPTAAQVRFVPGRAELASYREKDRTLTISPTAPRDLMVCMRGDCRLVEEWVGK